MVTVVVTSWVMYSWLEGAAPGCPSQQHCTLTFLGQSIWAAPSLTPSPCGCLRLPTAVETWTKCCGSRKGIQGLLFFPPEPNSNASPAQCPRQPPLTNKGLINTPGFRGFSTIFFFFPTQLPHHWANALMDTHHYLTSDLMGTANKWKAHKIKFTEHHSFCCPLTETIYQVKQIQGMELYPSWINAVTRTFQDPRLSSNCREVLWGQALAPGTDFSSLRGAPALWDGWFLFLKAWRSSSQLAAATFPEQESAVNLDDSVWFINTKTTDRLDEL